jgi:hypothetical protein
MLTGHSDHESVRRMGSRDQRPHCPLLSHGQHTLPAKNTSNTDCLFSPTIANPPSIGRLDSPIFERTGAGGQFDHVARRRAMVIIMVST